MGIYIGPFRFTRRGVRTRIGPRFFRLHAGAGGTGISSGAGPVSVYVPIKGRHGRLTPADQRRIYRARRKLARKHAAHERRRATLLRWSAWFYAHSDVSSSAQRKGGDDHGDLS
jgi:hypothetical protein